MTLIKKLVAASLVSTAALGAGVAHARTDVQWTVQIAGPIGVTIGNQPAVRYVRPVAWPVVVQPTYRQPVYAQPVYAQPVYAQPAYRPVRVVYPAWDRDGDGIPNRYDRVYNPRGDRDGDGIPNRYDRRDDRRYDHHDDWRDGRRDGRGDERHGGR